MRHRASEATASGIAMSNPRGPCGIGVGADALAIPSAELYSMSPLRVASQILTVPSRPMMRGVDRVGSLSGHGRKRADAETQPAARAPDSDS